MKTKKVTIHFWIEKSSYLFKRYLNWNEETVKKTKDYQLLKRYDVIQIGNTVKSIYTVAEGSSSIKYYVQKEDIFDVIHDAHLAIGHGGQNRMTKETQTKYKNIKAGSIMLYLSLCVPYLKKSKVPKKDLVIKPMIFNEINFF